MAKVINSHFRRKHPQGKKPMFSPEGDVALMFLKSYLATSDDGLVEMLNGNIHMQMFCGVYIDPERPIKNGKIVSAIRNRMANAAILAARQIAKEEKEKQAKRLRKVRT